MPELFEIYIIYKRCYINTLPFLSFTLSGMGNEYQSKGADALHNPIAYQVAPYSITMSELELGD